MKLLIVIDSEVVEVEEVNTYGRVTYLECDNGNEYIVFQDREDAGEEAAKYWQDMKDNDKEEFKCIIGTERLLQWACDESDSFGISSFDEFLEVVESVPEEHWASYDGEEIEISMMNKHLHEHLGLSKECVLYRSN